MLDREKQKEREMKSDPLETFFLICLSLLACEEPFVSHPAHRPGMRQQPRTLKNNKKVRCYDSTPCWPPEAEGYLRPETSCNAVLLAVCKGGGVRKGGCLSDELAVKRLLYVALRVAVT